MQTSRNQSGKDSSSKFTIVLFIIYLIALCWILLFKLGVRFSYMEMRIVNITPFRELFIDHARVDKAEIILNIIIFIPLGMYAGLIFKQWPWMRKLFLFFLVSAMFEAIQYICRIGAFDVTDIITNVLGGIIGLPLFEAIEKLFNNSRRAQKFINTIAAIGTVIMVSLLVLLKLNMLPIRYQ